MEDPKNIIPDYDLLAKYFAGEASMEQIEAIERWTDENAKNKKSFDSMYYLWIQSGRKTIESQINITESWAKMKFRMEAAKYNKGETIKQLSVLRKTSYRFMQLAAVIILGLIINALVKYLNPESNFISKESQLVSIDLQLSDSSEIKLNKKSKLVYPEKFKGKQRLVKLDGEAFFKIEPNKEKPFIIETQFSRIKVLGTSFNVQAYDTSDFVEVTVVTGVVELSGTSDGGEKIILKKGEKGKIEKSTGKPIKEEKIQDNELFWATRTLIFKDTELYIAAETISKAYNIEIELLNEEIKHCKLTVVFPDASIEEIMEVLRITFNLSIEHTNNQYKVNGNGCK